MIPMSLDDVSRSMKSCIQSWRSGNDHQGLQFFLQMIEQLESKLDGDLTDGEQTELQFILEEMYRLVQNRDVIGMTDALEFRLTPRIQQWEKGVGKDEN